MTEKSATKFALDHDRLASANDDLNRPGFTGE